MTCCTFRKTWDLNPSTNIKAGTECTCLSVASATMGTGRDMRIPRANWPTCLSRTGSMRDPISNGRGRYLIPSLNMYTHGVGIVHTHAHISKTHTEMGNYVFIF